MNTFKPASTYQSIESHPELVFSGASAVAAYTKLVAKGNAS